MKRTAAFTLVELLVVLVILAVLAGVLFPVFRSVKDAAKASVCISNFNQASIATQLYLTDYEDRFMPINYQPGEPADPAHDRTWVQMLLPYVREFSTFACPGDTSRSNKTEALFDEDLVPGDTYARYYNASMHTNLGYNYMYLSPVARRAGSGSAWESRARSSNSVASPSQTLLFIDSVWSVDENGSPQGGGSWLVMPPCRLEQRNGVVVDSLPMASTEEVFYTHGGGWYATRRNVHAYGNAWPWHSNRANASRMDGSVRSYRVEQLTAGCNMRSNWKGVIYDNGSYLWDLR